MRIIFFVLVSLSFINCSKPGDNNPPTPTVVDTLLSGWRKVTITSLPSSSDIFFINNTTGFVVAGNLIYRSTDGGNSWQKVYQSAVPALVNIGMGSAMNAVFVTGQGGSQKMFITSDGGNSFDSVIIADNNITDAFFVSPSVAYAIGQKCWKSTNGGRNWTSLSDLGQANYRSLHFLNEQTGWCAGSGGVFYTSNGGVTWTPQSTPGFNFIASGNVYFADANNGYISDDASIGKTINGGSGWTKVHSLHNFYHDLHFLSPSLGYVTDANYIYKTVDGGTSWTKEVRLVSDPIIELHFTDVNHGWATGGAGYILKYEH